MNCPDGAPDKFESCILEESQNPTWTEQKLEGSWLPEAFVDSISSLMCHLEGFYRCNFPPSVKNVVNT